MHSDPDGTAEVAVITIVEAVAAVGFFLIK